MMGESPDRGIIAAMPAFNEEQHVGSLVLKARKYAAEVIVLDDGSADATAEIARLAGATVISHPANQGKGAAVRTILSTVRQRVPRVLVLLDADGQHDPDEIPLLARAVLSDGCDLVVGTRRGQRSKTPFYRRIGQNVLSFSTSLASHGAHVKDSESGFRALSARAVREIELTENGFAIETEMIVKAAERGWKITEVPISTIYTRDGSTQNPFRHGLGVLGRIINMISDRRPLLFFGVTGTVLCAFGVAAGARVLAAIAEHRDIPQGTAVLSAMLIITGVFSGLTGILLHAFARQRRP